MKRKLTSKVNRTGIMIVVFMIFITACVTTSFDTAYRLQEENKLEEAVPFWEKALLEARLEGHFLDAAIVLSNLSRNYYIQKKYRKSIVYAEKALKEVDKVSDKKFREEKIGLRATSASRLGNNHFWLGQYSKARDHFDEAVRLEESLGKKGYSGNLGAVYHLLGDLDNAILNYQKAMVVDKPLAGLAGFKTWRLPTSKRANLSWQ